MALIVKISEFACAYLLLYFCFLIFRPMQEYTLSISENNSKALALLNYLKTLDFVSITKTTDWFEELSQEQKEAIDKGLEDIENGNVHKDKDVRKSIHQRILNAQK